MAIAKPPSKRQRRIELLEGIILGRFPDAKFDVGPLADTRGVTGIWTYTSGDPDEVRALVGDHEVDIMLEDGIHLLVMPEQLEASKE